MKFDEALKLMKQGKKVKLPHWQGYWCWDNGTVMIHSRTSETFDLFNTNNKEFTLDNIASDKFEVVQDFYAVDKAIMEAIKQAVTGSDNKIITEKSYKERFKVEYQQLKQRLDELDIMLTKHEAEVLEFTPTCPISMLEDQRYCMDSYLRILKTRAEIEGIDLG